MRTKSSEKDGLHLEVREIRHVRKSLGVLSEIWETEQQWLGGTEREERQSSVYQCLVNNIKHNNPGRW